MPARTLLLPLLLLACLGTRASDEATPTGGQELFRLDGQVYTPDTLSSRMSQLYATLITEHYSQLKSLIDEMIFDVYVEREAARLGKPVREVGFGMLKVAEPTEQEISAFYEQNKAGIGRPFEEVRDRLADMIRRQDMARKRAKILTRIKNEGDFELLAPPPSLPGVAIDLRGRPFKGNPDAPITLVEFGDYQCPNCKRAARLIDTLMGQHPDMLKVYFIDFPINPSGISREVAVGGVCALAQDRFWPYHDMAFAIQDRLHKASAVELARGLDLDMDAFRACLARPASRARVERSFKEARRLGITATPTLFVDGKPFVGSHLLRDLGAYIRKRQDQGSS